MTSQDFDYARTYTAMADEELLRLACDSGSLVEAARVALQSEIDRRGLKPQPLQPARIDMVPRCPGCGREATHPLTCGSCSTTICHFCGTPLEPD